MPQLQEMTLYIKSLGEKLAGAPWAVVTKKPSSFGTMRMLSVFAENIPMAVDVFGSFEAAEAWIADKPHEDG